MATTSDDTLFSEVSRITGSDEVLAVDVVEQLGRNALVADVHDIGNGGGVNGPVEVTTAPTALKVGVSNLTNRILIVLTNEGPQTMYFGYNSSVSASNGTPLHKGESAGFGYGPSTTLYGVTETSTATIKIMEAAR